MVVRDVSAVVVYLDAACAVVVALLVLIGSSYELVQYVGVLLVLAGVLMGLLLIVAVGAGWFFFLVSFRFGVLIRIGLS
ncbi:hypothetical protein [Microvirga guangxiensis]|uniref:Transmembrane protein n=1 Tax=Microvirga guangxiensis TaxID=549386 RepID=A0A1G5KLF9_9HYPH|nr:hypothetical protein [Microvirga guangxiensis]SCZ01483.1 hypothetical protein SAMN02927923_03448 [Microvirga guangxiensis]